MGNKEQTLSFVENWGHKTAAKNVVGRRIDYVLISSSKRIKMLGVGLLAPIKSPVVLKIRILDLDTQKFMHQKTFNVDPKVVNNVIFYYNFKNELHIKRSGVLLLMLEVIGGPTYTYHQAKTSETGEDGIRVSISRNLPIEVQRLISYPENSHPAMLLQGIRYIREDKELSCYSC